jgi:predicted nucleic acid-binding protein
VKLIDTTVAVDHLRGTTAAMELLERLVDEDETLATSELVRFELLAGVHPDEREALEQFFSTLVWLPVSEDVTRPAGRLAQEYRKAHSGIDDVDYLIAATAIVYDAELLTTNVRHYPMLPDVRAPY